VEEIVVGVDGSVASDAALRFAADEAHSHRCRLVAVHSWSMPVIMGSPYAAMPPIDPGELESAAKEVLARALARVLDDPQLDVPVEEVIVNGHAAETLLKRAAGARELVVGSRGRGGFAGVLLGSVSQHCAHHAPCPLVIVPAPRVD
jgi:nucleotide-binding universal stress UspA family protein